MNLKIKKNIVLIFLLVVFVTSCNYSGDRETNEKIYSGTEGLRIKFLPHSPPHTIYYEEGEPNEIPIMIEVENKGAAPTIANFYLTGIDPTYFKTYGIDPGRPVGTDCQLDFNMFGRDFSRLDIGCDWGGVLIDGVAQAIHTGDWENLHSTVTINNVDWFEQGCNVGASWFKLDNSEGFCSWFDQMHIGLEGSGTDWKLTSGNENVETILDSSTNPYIRFLAKSMIMIGGFADPMAKTKMIEGKTSYNREGGKEFIDFAGYLKGFPRGLKEYNPTLRLTACYYYSTIATPSVCIDPNPYSNEQKVCYAPEGTSIGLTSQGAPVAITKIQQQTTPNKIVFTIEISNLGGGTVFDFNNIHMCSPYFDEYISPKYKNRVFIEDIRISGQQLRCTPSREVSLYNGRGTVMCQFDNDWTGQSSAYETPLFIQLSYAYQDFEQYKIQIKSFE